MSVTAAGTVREIIYMNDDNGYTIAVLQEETLGEVTITGYMPSIREMDLIEVQGAWKIHDIYGRQLAVEKFLHKTIDTTQGAMAYLSSGAIEGVGRKMAQRIVKEFGKEAIHILEKQPQRLMEIEGIGAKKLEKIIASHNEGRELREIVSALVPHGISPAYCLRIFKTYKEEALQRVMANPYHLCRDVQGIGFKKADEIAQKLGAGLESKERVEEGIQYVLQEAVYEGHTYMNMDQLIQKSAKLLQEKMERIGDILADLVLDDSLVLEQEAGQQRIYLHRYNQAETRAAGNLIRIATGETQGAKMDQQRILGLMEDIQRKESMELSPEQEKVIREGLSESLMIVTGGPGTGKTTTINFIIQAYEEEGKKVLLCAPTGRAAKRMTEATGKNASTIHRLLEVQAGEEGGMAFLKNEEDPIHGDVIIVDEISMVDILLFDSLLRAIATGTKVILVGDKDQLPSVGAGAVFKDILESGVIKTFVLTEVFRQARESMIIVNAHKINHGEMPALNHRDKDFFFMERQSQEDIAQLIRELAGERLGKYYGFKPSEIQVLSPIKKTQVGVIQLNEILQETMNPITFGVREHKHGGRILRTKDRVMHIKNNYDKKWENQDTGVQGEGIFNGDIGYIDFIEPKEKKLYVAFEDGKRVEYDFTELDEIEHAYATTVHKSQGSEFPCVIMPITSFPPLLMSRRILYTAITRAKKILVLVGNVRFLRDMVSNIHEEQRNTTLGNKLNLFREFNMLEEIK